MEKIFDYPVSSNQTNVGRVKMYKPVKLKFGWRKKEDIFGIYQAPKDFPGSAVGEFWQRSCQVNQPQEQASFNSSNEEIGRCSLNRYGSAKEEKREDEAVERQASQKQKRQGMIEQVVGDKDATTTERQQRRCSLNNSKDEGQEQGTKDTLHEAGFEHAWQTCADVWKANSRCRMKKSLTKWRSAAD